MKKQSWICLLLIAALVLGCSGCIPQARAADLMEGVTPNRPAELHRPTELQQDAAADFALRLFRAGRETGKNSLLSPLSAACALAMIANGAKGETLRQMEAVLGMDRAALNDYFRAFLDTLQEDGSLKLADAIWFRDDGALEVNRDFLQTNADCYGADARSAPFDEQTKQEINAWVKEKTDGMIPEILDEIPEDAVMYLVNALAFEARWEEPYRANNVKAGDFRCADGTIRAVEMMRGSEGSYLESDRAVGFIKPYAGGKYGFAALLPAEGVSPEALLDSLDGPALRALLTEPQQTTVFTAMPKFETRFGTELGEALKELGMPLAFDPDRAELSGIGSAKGNLYINRVLHRSFISVGEQGTRAGAATAVEVNGKGAMPMEPKEIILDRPFVYMLIDVETGVPFFVGILNDPS